MRFVIACLVATAACSEEHAQRRRLPTAEEAARDVIMNMENMCNMGDCEACAKINRASCPATATTVAQDPWRMDMENMCNKGDCKACD